MKIQAPKKSTSILAPILTALLVLIFIGAGLVALLYSQKPSQVPAFNIESFAGAVEASGEGSSWFAPTRGDSLRLYSWLRTGEDGEVDLSFGKSTFLRVKENTLIQIQTPQIFTKAEARVHLEKGALIVWNQNDMIQVSVPGKPTSANQGFLYDVFAKFFATAQGSAFRVTAVPGGDAQVSVLQGEVMVQPGLPFSSTAVKALEMTAHQSGKLGKSAISEKEWGNVREAYEIQPKSAASEAVQLDLSKKAGNFFDFVFDHGSFFQDKWGWCFREFMAPEEVDQPVYLEATYDVFPKGSWVGLYFKTRKLDLQKYKGFRVEVKRAPGKDFPEAVRLEFKSRYSIVRAFAIKMVREEWEPVEFTFNFSKPTDITEATLIFAHDRVGPHKSGALLMRNFTFIPADVPEEPAPVETPGVSQPAATEEAVVQDFEPAPAANDEGEAIQAELADEADASGAEEEPAAQEAAQPIL